MFATACLAMKCNDRPCVASISGVLIHSLHPGPIRAMVQGSRKMYIVQVCSSFMPQLQRKKCGKELIVIYTEIFFTTSSWAELKDNWWLAENLRYSRYWCVTLWMKSKSVRQMNQSTWYILYIIYIVLKSRERMWRRAELHRMFEYSVFAREVPTSFVGISPRVEKSCEPGRHQSNERPWQEGQYTQSEVGPILFTTSLSSSACDNYRTSKSFHVSRSFDCKIHLIRLFHIYYY